MREEKDFFAKSFGKGNGLTFLYLKEKLQKKQTILLVDRRLALYRKARSLYAKA